MLVQLNIFKEVYFSMLPPGHTHEFQDAEFSVVKRAYSQSSTSTLKEFPKLSECAFIKTNKHRLTLEALVFDWKKWFKPFIAAVHGHSAPYSFCLKWNEDESKVLMTYKNWWTDPTTFHGSAEHPDGIEVCFHHIILEY